MGHIYYRKIIILVVSFALTSILVYGTPTSRAVKKQMPLAQALANIKGWTSGEHVPLHPKFVDELNLDDYLNQSYFDDTGNVFLYIGYYLTTKKIGALHDPLVCFPGQGWVVSNRQRHKFVLNSSSPYSISCSTMIIQRGIEKQLILYWFQSYDQTNPDTFSQKTTSLWKKFLDQREDNAFVRVTTPVSGKSLSEARRTTLNFVQAFYPVFLDYVREGS